MRSGNGAGAAGRPARAASVATALLLGLAASAIFSPIQASAIWDDWNAGSQTVFPDPSWQRYATPEDAGWSSQGLARAREFSESVGSAAAFVVYDGAVLAHWGETERRFDCHSMRKSLLSALYGIAVSDGRIDLGASIGALGIDDDTGLTPTEKRATVADLLKARSGVYLPAAYESAAMASARPARGSHEPGAHWYYNNWDFNVLGTIYNRQTGSDLFESFASKIAAPLGMQDFDVRHTYYHLEARHSRHPAYPFRMSARDLARFGLLFLSQGRWKVEQVVPADWVRESTRSYSDVEDGGGYGYMWWTKSGHLKDLGAYAALGSGGHTVYVVPGARLVFVHRSNTFDGPVVSYENAERILTEILAARTGPPQAGAALEPMPDAQRSEPPSPLPGDAMADFIGGYGSPHITVTVRVSEGHLEAFSPAVGRYRLLPLEKDAFLAEDRRLRVEFTRDAEGRISAVEWTNSRGRRVHVPRLP